MECKIEPKPLNFLLTASKYVQDIWRAELLNLCPILFLNKGAHRHGNIDLYIMGIYNSKKQKIQCGGNLTTLASETEKIRSIRAGKFSEISENIPRYELGATQN